MHISWKDFFASRNPGQDLQEKVKQLEALVIIHANYIDTLLEDIRILRKTNGYRDIKHLEARRKHNDKKI